MQGSVDVDEAHDAQRMFEVKRSRGAYGRGDNEFDGDERHINGIAGVLELFAKITRERVKSTMKNFQAINF